MLEDAAEADVMLDRWLHKFTVIQDRGLRRNVLLELVESTDDGTLIGLLPRLDARAEQGERAVRWLQTELALTPSVLAELPYDRIAELYAIARAAGQERLALRFLTDKPIVQRVAIETPQIMPVAIGRPSSAGERTARAKSRDRMALDRLMHDRDPRIIRVLLDNPIVIERDVVRIAAMRPTNPAVLELLASHPRWSPSYRVRTALAFNPFTPTKLARQLLPTLFRQDLLELQGSKILPLELHADLHALLHPPRSRPALPAPPASDPTPASDPSDPESTP